MKEVADAMQCPLQTAYSRLHAARRIVLEAAKRFQLTRGGA
jgi:DNA-directed RNA polymerase specialized sigma24 family protein